MIILVVSVLFVIITIITDVVGDLLTDALE